MDFQYSSMTRKTFVKTNHGCKVLFTLSVSGPALTLVWFLGVPTLQSPDTTHSQTSRSRSQTSVECRALRGSFTFTVPAQKKKNTHFTGTKHDR